MAKNILIIYSSIDGHTISICKHISKSLEESHFPKLMNLENIKKSESFSASKVTLKAQASYKAFFDDKFINQIQEIK